MQDSSPHSPCGARLSTIHCRHVLPLPSGPEPLTPTFSFTSFPPAFCLLTLFATGLDKGLGAAEPRPCARPPCPSSHHTGAI